MTKRIQVLDDSGQTQGEPMLLTPAQIAELTQDLPLGWTVEQ